MKVQIVYSSLSGCTRRLAEGIFAALPVADKSPHVGALPREGCPRDGIVSRMGAVARDTGCEQKGDS